MRFGAGPDQPGRRPAVPGVRPFLQAPADPALAPTAPPSPSAAKCVGSTVSIKVQNAIIDPRGKPETAEKPQLGETPDPVLSNDPLLEPTPKAS